MQKYLSGAGVASRREAEVLILQGRVRVNGELVVELGTRIHPERDQVEVDGRPVRESPLRWVLLNKPAGTLCTRRDPRGRSTVYGLLPQELRELRYVGRLDQDTEGLLLLTNQGELVHRLTHPSYRVEREYLAWVEKSPSTATVSRLERGVVLEDGPARAEAVQLLGSSREGSRISLVLREGRKREVRRLLDAVGLPVVRLRRVRFGPLRLGSLEAGEWRDLGQHEIRALQRAVRLEETT